MTFEEYLDRKCFELNPGILDDDMPDYLTQWIDGLEVSDVLEYVKEYEEIKRKEEHGR